MNESSLNSPRANATRPVKGEAMTLSRRQWFSLFVMLTGTFMAIMDVFIVNVAIPSIQRELKASVAEIEFIIAGYGLTYALSLITSGRLGDIYGRRRLFMIGLAAFAFTSLGCGLAPTAPMLVLARLFQGVAAAILFPQVFSLIRITFTQPTQRRIAFSSLGAAIGLAVIAGQVLGGFLVDIDLWHLGWRVVFLINVPIGLTAFIVCPMFIVESRASSAGTLDGAGVALSGAGLALLLFPMIQGRDLGWPIWSVIMMLFSVPVLLVFVLHQRSKTDSSKTPLLDITLFRDRDFLIGAVTVLVFYSTLNSTYLALTMLLQTGLGRSPLSAGLILAANAGAFTITSLLSARIPAHKVKASLIVGATVTAVSSIIAAVIVWRTSFLLGTELIPALALRGIGQGLLMTPLLGAILARVDERRAGAASGLLSTMQQVGGAIGVAIVGIAFFSVVGSVTAAGGSVQHAYTAGFIAASIYGAVGVAITGALLSALSS
ncbi:MFS transporter [Caballeronia fortuita]|uniref:MFS transporter n=1 Tax=Caballeronia fortuita TaxID=1777138 RepID=A0A158CTS6_9BURK|nr:MFS transporter [Caballeronia fortuita]SAK85714.1 MFS transporter [Caballeronia fortuita]